MSGGVGPCGDINLPKEKEEEEGEHLGSTKKTQNENVHHHNRFLTFQQLNALVVMVVFSTSGMVAIEDFAFSIFSIFYVFFISRIAFPLLHPSRNFLISTHWNKLLALCNAVGAVIGLFLPLVYIFEGIYEGDKEGIKAAAPHVFLLASQTFLEGVVSWRRFSEPMRAFVIVFFNTKRLMTICEWVRKEISKADEEFGSVRRLHVGRGLALTNLVFWSFYLFGFLLPCYLPRAFKRYYGYKPKD